MRGYPRYQARTLRRCILTMGIAFIAVDALSLTLFGSISERIVNDVRQDPSDRIYNTVRESASKPVTYGILCKLAIVATSLLVVSVRAIARGTQVHEQNEVNRMTKSRVRDRTSDGEESGVDSES